ncbi:nucleoside deaminase [Arthrobacter sp. B2a2-09]|uniref:nucleoside deaminase n=1 Tax=Arthrobacter sp. B2a2-09 TaxID=2952822 RepID=UPI0022CD7B85|nr:nucleoside deaminase [Arthrobacter sp. B2a2-09]MCZ9884932.1 nucleoside deaminase [Arthrobacter sp. B2a2-09]
MNQQTSDADRAFLATTIQLAKENVAAGGGPFGALLVDARGEVVAVGQNRVTRDNDPTAHAEVVAIRAAAQSRQNFNLSGLTLYSSCEPCPMCLASSLWARVDRIVFAADRHDAAEGGFDDLEFYELFARDRSTWGTPIDWEPMDDRGAPFDAWRAEESRIDY